MMSNRSWIRWPVCLSSSLSISIVTSARVPPPSKLRMRTPSSGLRPRAIREATNAGRDRWPVPAIPRGRWEDGGAPSAQHSQVAVMVMGVGACMSPCVVAAAEAGFIASSRRWARSPRSLERRRTSEGSDSMAARSAASSASVFGFMLEVRGRSARTQPNESLTKEGDRERS